ncbi:MAG: hypothetical protein WDM96_05315 [Lacunisphaera sp.]
MPASSAAGKSTYSGGGQVNNTQTLSAPRRRARHRCAAQPARS